MKENKLNFKGYAKTLNDLTFGFYYNQLQLIARAIFEYKGLPEDIKEEYIERFLFEDGCCMFYKQKENGLMIARVNKVKLNYYEEPTHLTPVLPNYLSVETYKNDEEAILIKNNDMQIPTDEMVKLFAYRIADTTRSIDINVAAQKTPILIITTDKQKLTMKNVFNQYSGNEPVIFGDKSGDIDNVSVLKTDAPIVFDKLQEYKNQLFNEFLTWLGINSNPNQDKKERQITDEVNANNEEVLMCFNTMFKQRKLACDKINDLFGTKISVKKRVDLKAILEVMKDSEDDSNGSEDEVA